MADARQRGCTMFTAPFPEPVGQKVYTAPFLDAAGGVIRLVDKLGKAFAPVRYDINGNIQKLAAKHREDSERYELLNDMILIEKAEGGNRATDALLWLRRALHFVHDFLLSLIEDTRALSEHEDLAANVEAAYAATLRRHHGWMAQRLFSVLSKMMPGRSQLLRAVTLDREASSEDVLAELERYLTSLNLNLVVLAELYEDCKLSPPDCKNH